jgi:hypothetical protein
MISENLTRQTGSFRIITPVPGGHGSAANANIVLVQGNKCYALITEFRGDRDGGPDPRPDLLEGNVVTVTMAFGS